MDIGFSFLPAFYNQGYAYERALKVKELALTEFGLKQISAITTKTNYPSQKLIKKLGLKFIDNKLKNNWVAAKFLF